MPINLYNKWRLEVLEAIHSWENRYVISGASIGNGTYDPVVGNVQQIDGNAWQIDAQHQPPNENWVSSPMKQEVVTGMEHVNLHLIIGAEDPLPVEDYKDIRLSAIFLGGKMIEVPYRPYAVRIADLEQMPDGIFEAKLGQYYMGVRVKNIWGIPFTSDNVFDISEESRADLFQKGIQILDSWTQEELDVLGQEVTSQGIKIGHLIPEQSRTIYFKIDVTNAQAKKYEVEFICRNIKGMTDPNHSGRKTSQQIFISRMEYDSTTNSYHFDLPQGRMVLGIDKVAIDEKGYKESVKAAKNKCKKENQKPDVKELRAMLKSLLSGKDIDICEVQRLLSCYCHSSDDGRNPKDLFCYNPYYLILTKMNLKIFPKAPYSGQFGSIPYDDPWWKVLLAIIAAILALLGGAEEGAQAAYEDEDLIIGKLDDFERHQLDAALCRIDTSRELKFRTVLDAQSDEDNVIPVIDDNLDGLIEISSDFLTKDEIDNLIMEAEESGDMSGLKVFKSGAKTGTTIAQIGEWVSPWQRCDLDEAEKELDPDCSEHPEKITRFDDEDRPTLRFEVMEGGDANSLISNRGDSGSVWVHFDSKRPVALNHSGNRDNNTAIGSLLEFVADHFNITF